MRRTLVPSFLVIALSVVATACGGGSAPATSAAPTPLSAGGAGATGATITGALTGAVTTVGVVGTPLTSPVDSSGAFELRGVPSGDAELRFTSPGVDARLTIPQVTDQERIELKVSVSASGAAIESQQRSGPNQTLEVEGLITAIDTVGRTVVVQGKTVSIPTTAVIRHGSTVHVFADLEIGDRIHVKATDVGGVITAQTVFLQNDQSGGSTSAEQQLEGRITTVTPASQTFVVDGAVTVTIGSTTVIRHGSVTLTFADLKVGYRVHVKGTRTGSTMAATRVDVQNDNPVPPDGFETTASGQITALSGSCPRVTFTVNGTTVTTSPLTTYAGGGKCADLAAGAKVDVKGIAQPDSSIAASWVKFGK